MLNFEAKLFAKGIFAILHLKVQDYFHRIGSAGRPSVTRKAENVIFFFTIFQPRGVFDVSFLSVCWCVVLASDFAQSSLLNYHRYIVDFVRRRLDFSRGVGKEASH